MNELKGKTAVITGAGSGFGRELALLCAAENMHLALADIDRAGLEATQALLPAGTQTLLQHCDVSKPESVAALAEQTWARYGAAHLLSTTPASLWPGRRGRRRAPTGNGCSA
jgi:NAD(P)-dependent dehydrogenase (short-subunit alcohol dehydrogenase family)